MHKEGNILLSYPRSGNSWIRYCVEAITKKPTYGYTKSKAPLENPIGSNIPTLGVDLKVDPILLKRHETFSTKRVDKLILVIRNYKEVIVRHHEGTKITLATLQRSCSSNKTSRNYVDVIRYFDDFKGEKLLVYYEDFITDVECELRKIAEFLGEGVDNIDEFVNKLDGHKKKSLTLYRPSITKGKNVIHHSNKLTKGLKSSWDKFLRNKCGDLFEKYLIRYEEKKGD